MSEAERSVPVPAGGEYVGGRLAAEAFLAYGSGLEAGAPDHAPLALTAAMPALCTTRSLDNPVPAASAPRRCVPELPR